MVLEPRRLTLSLPVRQRRAMRSMVRRVDWRDLSRCAVEAKFRELVVTHRPQKMVPLGELIC